jgi:predicted small secreted protein
MKNILLVLALAAASALLTGCRSSDTGVYRPINKPGTDLENYERFVLFDKAAQRSVTVTGIQEGRLPDGRLQVSANVRNRENRRIQVQINCVFKDAQGFVIDETPFQNLFLDENAQEAVRFASMNERALRYTIRVRQAR